MPQPSIKEEEIFPGMDINIERESDIKKESIPIQEEGMSDCEASQSQVKLEMDIAVDPPGFGAPRWQGEWRAKETPM